MTADFTLRPETPADDAFLLELFASLRAAEFAPLGWPPQALTAFLAEQRRLQALGYERSYPDGERLIIEADDAPIGRLYLDRGKAGHHLVDIALIPAMRGQGIGEAILSWILGEAAHRGVPVSLSVEMNSPARRLYERLGFEIAGETPTHLLMRCTPA